MEAPLDVSMPLGLARENPPLTSMPTYARLVAYELLPNKKRDTRWVAVIGW